ncbi:VWA domain-containing protein [Planococcus sp. CPCC 101016]|uniref:VWA domain-containing protein n=1 Tax=Planococcus sp. CPCC 101016 TaxID=2599617 RepID=UPI0011B6ADD2|nr:VWA domain-containing protein [Planococcus sp. CPCC 101016]TWT07370.1 VWA domain-containing protein [Planococcus sp. CPCC 101016]
MELRLDNSLWLLLLLPTLVYFGWFGLKNFRDSSKLQKIVFLLRIAVVALLIFALASPSLLRPVKEEQVIFLMDRSASLKGMETEMTLAVENALSSKKDHQSVAVYTFAEDFLSLLPMTKEPQTLPAELAAGQNGHTNIARALELASNSGNTDLATRLVLLTDGNETQSSAIESLNRLESERLQVDVWPIEQSVQNDLAVSRFETPSRAFLGEAQSFSVTIDSDTETEAKLIFSANDRDLDTKEIELSEGQNVFNYSYPATSEGLLKYEVRVETADDAFLENNSLASITEVSGSPEVLVVNGGEPSPIPGLLDTENLRVTELSSAQLPSSLSAILRYDSIIFDNVSGTAVGEQQMTIIEQAVQQFGVGFMMVGGEQSFGLGGYFKTPIERLLPVEMEVKGKHELPSLGLMIVMDRSGSMLGMKMELAKEAAARSVELLRPDDTLGVIAFDDRPWEILPTAKVSDPQAAVDKILAITPGGGTEIYRSLEQAYSELEDLELQRKHIILLTDGQSATSSDYDALIENGKDKNITLSTVSIGQDADRNLLEQLADTGSGRFYDVIDATTIPAILSRETIMMSRTYIVDKPFTPIVYSSRWDDLFDEGIPQLNSYIATTAKSTASVALESEEGDPVLASWNYGLGKTVAYTSGSGAWSGDFQSWSRWPDFWNRSAAQLLPAYEEIPYSVTRKEQGVYTVEDPTQSSAILTVAAVDEQGNEVPLQTEPLAPGKVDVKLDAEPGLIFFSISNENGAAYKTGLTIPYGDEYQTAAANMPLMTTLAERTGGQVLGTLDEAFRDMTYTSGTVRPIQLFLLLAAMVLFFLDITLRRFGLPKPALKRKATKEEPSSPAAVDQLIKAKKRS